MHGAVVWYLTGSEALGLAEFVAHFATDYLKCDGRITFNQDQFVHVACKAVFAALVFVGAV